MVWSQYVYEAHAGLDAVSSDDDDPNGAETSLLNVHDFQDEYSEDLYYLWDALEELMYDMFVDTRRDFSDFVDLCYAGAYSHPDEEDIDVNYCSESDIQYIYDTLRKHDRNGFLKKMPFNNFFNFLDPVEGNFKSRG